MSRTDAIHETLQSNVSAIVQLTVSYPSFHAPEYAVPTESLVGRLWAYDAASNVVVLETGHTSALAPSMRRAAASAVCETSPRVLSNSGALAGFKMVRASKIQRVDVLQDDQSIPLTTVHPVPVAAIEARDAAAKKKCQERVAQLAPSNVSDVGQVVFDAVNKTLPCRWHDSHIIVLDEVVISGPTYDISTTYVPGLPDDQLQQLLHDEDANISSQIERANDKARTWQRVTRVLDSVHAQQAARRPSLVERAS